MLYYTFGVSMCFLANHLVIGMRIEGSGINLFEQPNEKNDNKSDTFLAVPLLRPTDLVDSHYAPWTEWSACTRHCKQKRHRQCRKKGDNCTDGYVVKESRHCQEGRCSPGHKKENKTQNDNVILDREMANIIYDILYYAWSEWSTCTRSCKQKRIRTCAVKAWCHNTIMQEEKQCFPEGSACEKHAIYSINKEKGKKPTELTTTAIPHPTVKSTTKLKTDGKTNVKTEKHALQCGIRKHEIVKRVVGGIEAHRGHWPWQVALLKKAIFGQHWEQYCGGTLIGSQWVLTAAHCVRRPDGRNKKVRVRIGEHDFDIEEGSEIVSHVGNYIVHPGYERKTIDNDIALLQLKKPVTLSDHVDFACVPDQGQKAPLDSECYTIGWGKVRETHIFGSSILQQARVPLVKNSKCQDAFEYSIPDNQFCAGDHKGGVDSCSGDSGGPLMCRLMSDDGIKRWFVYGVTSFGEGCGEKGKYGIYSKVPNYSRWINEKVNEYS